MRHNYVIEEAEIRAGLLVVVSDSHVLRIPVELIPGLMGQPLKFQKRFIICDGIMEWKYLDTMYDWEHLLWVVKPSLEITCRLHRRDFYRRYGAAIKMFRKEMKLTRHSFDLLHQTIEAIENGEVDLNDYYLEHLANGHGLEKEAYVKEINERWSSK